MAHSHIFQILAPQVSRSELDPGFSVLDNMANERPDWYEYWPIRNFLLKEALDDTAFYGFVSPKFQSKTNLTAAQVFEFIEQSPAGTEVVLFSPSIHTSAHFLNVFEQGEAEHPGLMGTSKDFLRRIGMAVDLDELVCDSRNTVTSNYFAAKPRFWRAWLALNEQLFAIAEASPDALGKALTAHTEYRGAFEVQMKVFIMERIASLILASDRSFACRAHDPFVAENRIYKLPLAIVCDALKIAYQTQGFGQYKEVFRMVGGLRRAWNLHVRIAAQLGLRSVRPHTHALAAYWHQAQAPGSAQSASDLKSST
jgi:hypothetical protein